jgi:hypothetical protein
MNGVCPLKRRHQGTALRGKIKDFGNSTTQVFAVFFKPQTRNFHQTKFSSRALESGAFHPKRLACATMPRGVEGRSPHSFLSYFLVERQEST